jgi:hypothetical protein
MLIRFVGHREDVFSQFTLKIFFTNLILSIQFANFCCTKLYYCPTQNKLIPVNFYESNAELIIH